MEILVHICAISICANIYMCHIYMCQYLYVPISICANIYIQILGHGDIGTYMCHIYMCQYLNVPISICANIYICQYLYMPIYIYANPTTRIPNSSVRPSVTQNVSQKSRVAAAPLTSGSGSPCEQERLNSNSRVAFDHQIVIIIIIKIVFGCRNEKKMKKMKC